MTTATFVTISCQTCCLSSTLSVDALLLTLAPDGTSAAGRERADDSSAAEDRTAGTVAWACARCDDLVSARLDWATLLALVAAGASLLEDPDSDERAGDTLPRHPENPAGGAPLTPDDVLALHELLASDTWFAQVSPADRVDP